MMKNKYDKSKTYLIEALKNLPSDFRLQEARSYINAAIHRIEDVEKKRTKREATESPNQQWQFKLNQGIINTSNPENVVKGLDQLIAEEKSKLIELKRNKEEQSTMDNLNDPLNLNG